MPAKAPQKEPLTVELQIANAYFDQVLELVKQTKLPGPVVPDLLAKVIRLTMNPDVTFIQISHFAEQHQALYAKLLAVVNSAYYARGPELITTLESAIARLGLRQTSSILHAVATRSYMVGKDAALRALILRNLEVAFLVAMASQAQAERDKYRKSDDAYTVGLFHNIGLTFFLYTLGLLQDKRMVGSIDVKMIGSVGLKRAAELNRAVADKLGLPPDIVSALRFPEKASDDTTRIVAYVHRSMWLAEKLMANRTPEDVVLDVEGEVLGVTPEMVEMLKAKSVEWLELLRQYIGT